MKKIINYILILSSGDGLDRENVANNFVYMVKSNIIDGFQPIGGICTSYRNSSEVTFSQAMVKYEC